MTRDKLRESTGWDLRFASGVGETELPTVEELDVLRDLYRRTGEAHRSGGSV